MSQVPRAFLCFCFAASLCAAPKLRLVNTTIGPISIAAGASGGVQTLEAFNAGDGSLNLALSTSATWIAPSVGTPRPCSARSGNCIPLQFGLQTGSLAKGNYTAVVAVNDPNAVDAPQTIALTIQIGGAIPDQIDLYLPPDGSSDRFAFRTNSPISGEVSTKGEQGWLSFALDGAGTYRFVFPYRIVATRQTGMGAGDYQGSVRISGSSFAGDNKAADVTLHVTSQPIAVVEPGDLRLRTIANVAGISANISVFNRGLRTLSIASVVASSSSFSPTATQTGATKVKVIADTSKLSPGLYTGSVTITTNAANGTMVVPVNLEIIPPGPPVAAFRSVVNNATFETDDPVAQGAVVAVFGEQLSNASPQQGSQLPLVTQLGGAQVLVNGQPAPLFYSSYGQINFQVPYETPAGEARVEVVRDGQPGNTVSVQVKPIAPRLLLLGIGEYGLIVNSMDGTFPVPTSLGIGGHPAHVGDTLTIYAIGFGATEPAVLAGAPAPTLEPFARVTLPTRVLFGNRLLGAAMQADPLFVGLTPNFVGLYQINVTIPPGTASNDELPVNVIYGTGGEIGSQVRIAVQ